MKKLLLAIACLLFATLHAQQFGGNPASIRWRQLNTDTARIIFPEGLESNAQRIASIIHTLQRNYQHNLGDQLRKINIVLHDQTLLSNGYVQLAPRRSEFFLTPPQDPFELGAVSWTDNLATHEFRHVQQYNNFNKGFSRFMSVLFGEQGQALANAAAIPDWFFEGDAVFNETRLTGQGRGALPLFLSSYRTLWNAKREYNYQQLRNGSLRKYIPGHYELGYLLVAYGRSKYGDDIWGKITDDAARFNSFFYPFQGAVKKNTGVSFKQFVNDAFAFYHTQWPAETEPVWMSSVTKNNVTNYLYPSAAGDGALIVLKKDGRHVPGFYKIGNDGREEKIVTRDLAIDDQFSYNNGRIVYAAYQPDERWGFREFTNLKLVNTSTGEETTIARNTRYFSPDVSHDGQQIAAVEVDRQQHARIVKMDADGKLRDSIAHTGLFFSNPKFSSDDSHIYAVARNTAGEMALMKYGDDEEQLLPFANRLIGYLTVQGDTIVYTQTHEGRDEIWALIDGKQRKGPFRLASYATGLYQGVLRDGNLIASAFTADGYRLASFKPAWTAAEGTAAMSDLYVGQVFAAEDHAVIQHLHSSYPVSKYSKLTNLFNFHSYRPYFEDPEYSFTVYGENVLNTFQSQLAYTYNRNEASHKLGFNGIYGGSYVEPLLGISQTWQRSALLNKDTSVNWNELVGYAGLQLPLNLSGGKRYRYLTLSGILNIDQVKWTGIATKLLRDETVNYVTGRLVYTSQQQKALQNIYPHAAETLLLQYRRAVNGIEANQFLVTMSMYLPGLSINHNLVLTAAYHARDTMNRYLFSNNFPFARGYNAVDFPRMWRIGANYHLPLAYPDWGFGQIVYFLRARANLFYDYSRGKSLRTGIEYPFNTVGAELFFDTRWWNQQPVTFGVRYSRLLNNEFRGITQPNVWEFILPVSLFN